MLGELAPKVAGESCVGQPFNSATCPEWKARHGNGPFFISAMPIPNQPSTQNCAGCSPRYYWNEDATLQTMEVFLNGGDGATSELFMCDFGEY